MFCLANQIESSGQTINLTLHPFVMFTLNPVPRLNLTTIRGKVPAVGRFPAVNDRLRTTLGRSANFFPSISIQSGRLPHGRQSENYILIAEFMFALLLPARHCFGPAFFVVASFPREIWPFFCVTISWRRVFCLYLCIHSRRKHGLGPFGILFFCFYFHFS